MQVVPKVPYIMSDEYVRHVIQKYRIDYVVHGNEMKSMPCVAKQSTALKGWCAGSLRIRSLLGTKRSILVRRSV